LRPVRDDTREQNSRLKKVANKHGCVASRVFRASSRTPNSGHLAIRRGQPAKKSDAVGLKKSDGFLDASTFGSSPLWAPEGMGRFALQGADFRGANDMAVKKKVSKKTVKKIAKALPKASPKKKLGKKKAAKRSPKKKAAKKVGKKKK
jgi:uncharacterized protein (DUF1800 family)